MKYLLIYLMLIGLANAETLLVVTHGGNVSLNQNLDVLTCKKLACSIKIKQACSFIEKCNEETGEPEYKNNSTSTCSSYLDKNTIKTIECVK